MLTEINRNQHTQVSTMPLSVAFDLDNGYTLSIAFGKLAPCSKGTYCVAMWLTEPIEESRGFSWPADVPNAWIKMVRSLGPHDVMPDVPAKEVFDYLSDHAISA